MYVRALLQFSHRQLPPGIPGPGDILVRGGGPLLFLKKKKQLVQRFPQRRLPLQRVLPALSELISVGFFLCPKEGNVRNPDYAKLTGSRWPK